MGTIASPEQGDIAARQLVCMEAFEGISTKQVTDLIPLGGVVALSREITRLLAQIRGAEKLSAEIMEESGEVENVLLEVLSQLLTDSSNTALCDEINLKVDAALEGRLAKANARLAIMKAQA